MNLLLVDNELKLVEWILRETNWNISLLITIDKECNYKNCDRVEKILSELDFWNHKDLDKFDYDDINNLRDAQVCIESATYREISDFQIGKWIYYKGYAFVKQIFDENEFDIVIVKGPNHGYIYDKMITSFATYRGIQSYNIEANLCDLRVIYDNLNEKILEIKDNEDIDVSKSLRYIVTKEQKRKVCMGWSGIYAFSYFIAGKLGEELIKCIRYKNRGKDKLGISIFEKIDMHKQSIKNKRYYHKISVPINFGKKYILFALHLEPEATITGMTEMESQLVAINMLSQCLPKGWNLYVKEHPHQYWGNTDWGYDAFLYGTPIYKTRRFYQEINKLENVSIINIDANIDILMEKAVAIATMSGTIASEAIEEKKPVILFSTQEYFYKYVQDILKVRSYEDCKNAIKKLEKGYVPTYSDYKEVCNKYLLDCNEDADGYQRAIRTIKRHCEIKG